MSLLLVALMNAPMVDISFTDSRDDAAYTYLTVGDCKLKIKKSELKDTDRIIKILEDKCGPKDSKPNNLYSVE